MAKDPNKPDLNKKLLHHLQKKNELVIVFKCFSGLKTNEGRVNMAYHLLEENKILPKLSLDKKNDQKSEEFRQKGNEWFKRKNARKSHEFYTMSIAFAESGTQNLALAYANRSAVLLENGLYQECLIDINLALKNNYPEKLMPKLLARQANATELLPTQEKVDFFTPVPFIPKKRQNPLIQSAMDSIKIEDSRTFGRHIVATKDIEPGEIIAIEKPFCQALIDKFFTHCHYCLKLCYTLIPCDTCTEAMFCSESCKLTSYQSYHQFECKILLTIQHMELIWHLIYLRVAIVARNKYDELSNLVPDKNGMYRSDRYEEIHHLIANTEKRSVFDLFNRAVFVAALFHLLKTHTDFFKTGNSEEIFKGLLLHHMQTGPCNFHGISDTLSSDKLTEEDLIGCGAYSFLSMFNHSCCPNVVRYSYGTTTIITALESINKGEQCFDNYGFYYGSTSKSDRQEVLQDNYFFKCECLACTNPFYELLKPEIDLGAFLLESDDLEMVKKLLQPLIATIKLLEKTKPNKVLADTQECLKLIYYMFSTIKTPV